MKISVFITLPTNPHLVESAQRAYSARVKALSNPLDKIPLPESIDLDRTIPAIPIGSGEPNDLNVDNLRPEKSARFLLHAYMEVDDPAQLPDHVGDIKIFSNPRIAPAETCLTDHIPIGDKSHVASLLRTQQLWSMGLDGAGVAIAIVDWGFSPENLLRRAPWANIDLANSWGSGDGSIKPGEVPSAHGDVSAFDAILAAPKATLLDCPALRLRGSKGSYSEMTLLGPFQVLDFFIQKWAGGSSLQAQYPSLVISNSWYVPNANWDPTSNYINNPRHPFNHLIRVLANAGADIVFAAGNCGCECPADECGDPGQCAIMGANALSDVLTIGAADTTNNRLSYSSRGPSIANMYREKPDLVAYAHFLGSDADEAGWPDVGTSASCPVAAGCVAALRTRWKPSDLSPAALFSALRAHATRFGSQTGWNEDFGYGIINPVATAQNLP